ncbi:MAG: acyltransferase family protein [Pseudomonadota bacterium]
MAHITPPLAQPEQLAHPKYRADIDGLRAIAVLAVVGFHGFPGVVTGGFIGVDIFFVISGFLISTIIFSNLERNSFSFVEFYSRRIKRIFPALLLVLIATFAFGWFALLADEYKQLGKHVASGAGFVSNLVLWSESGYFDNAAETKPLLHLWSLGIEEQFYIVWPILLLFAWKRRFNLLLITIAIVIASFALNISKIDSDVVAAFYSPQTRFWELLTGSCLAYMSVYKHSTLQQLKLVSNNVQSWFGAVLIALAILLISRESAFPGWWALLPAVGALLIISAGPRAWLNRTVLSNRILVWFGLISFPLYLWHWPLLSFAYIFENKPGRIIRIGAVIISILLAWLTYRFVEKPVRFGRHGHLKIIALIGLMTALGTMGYSAYKFDGFEFRIDKDLSKKIEQISDRNFSNFLFNEKIDRVNGNCSNVIGKDTEGVYCQLMSLAPEILIIGDSHAISFAYAQVLKGNKDVAVVAALSCLPLLNFATADKNENLEHRKNICQKTINSAIKVAQALPSIKYVVLVGRGGYEFNITEFDHSRKLTDTQSFVAGYLETIDALQKLNKKVIFVVDVPNIGKSPKDCVDIRRIKLSRHTEQECTIKLDEYKKNQSQYRNLVRQITSQARSVAVFDPTDVFCDKEKCYGIKNDEYYYIDADHLSRTGSELIFNTFDKWLNMTQH